MDGFILAKGLMVVIIVKNVSLSFHIFGSIEDVTQEKGHISVMLVLVISHLQLSNLQSHIKTHGNQSLSTTQSNDSRMVSAIATVAALSCSKPTPFSQLGIVGFL